MKEWFKWGITTILWALFWTIVILGVITAVVEYRYLGKLFGIIGQ